MSPASARAIASSSRAAVRAIVTPTPTLARHYASSPSSTPNPDFVLPSIHLGPTHASRYHAHYDQTLASDLLYMTYNHRLSSTPTPPPPPPTASLKTAYELNRPTPLPRGNRPARPAAKALSASTVPRLESIVVHTMVKEAIGNKQALLSAIMALRAISGETEEGDGRSGSTGVQVIVSKSGAAAFKLRAGMPVAAQVELKGEAMYDFIQSLVDFVLPRLREFPGFAIPLASASKTSPSAVGGVVSVGLPHTAMGLFPQIEANLDSYPKLHGFHMVFKTNQKGERAQENARALLSGFRIPFYKR
ncbi:putative 60S ribosomal protein l7, mitochondrial precursor [Dioszegia hungarica]|uniref:60S ribosomal protein l7, mitochondrial n=1 Tax=Dioszegia hungarica TaxID=4972 RepID=A0AA38H1H0_9TREE|nr:putative 60S ribosomal protein l7, mitochondrial precursor [Dioszegia hungarica]KAI9632583.1 putative 60S ribosomal protein l7, mitochondrial precursor [Dioszegia hungarica]